MRLDEFHIVLDDALGSAPEPSDSARRAVRRRVVRRRALRTLAASTVMIVIAGMVVSIVGWPGRGGHTALSVNSQPSSGSTRPGWQQLPDPPYTDAVSAVRMGAQVLVAFGVAGLRFASFDPAAHRWEKLPAPPLQLQAQYVGLPIFANVGNAIIVFGHQQELRTPLPDAFAGPMRIMEYLPENRQWRVLPNPPLPQLIQATPIWTGRELIVWGGKIPTASFASSAIAVAFDPKLGRWRRLPPGPLHPRDGAVVVWTGREMIVWGGFPTRPDRSEGAAFNPDTNTWRILPPSGLSTRTNAATAWTGRLFLVWGGDAAQTAAHDPNDGAAYNPMTNRWHPIAAAPISGRDLAAVTWTGHDLFVWGGQRFKPGRLQINPLSLEDGATYNPTTNTWHELPRAPLSNRTRSVTVWTGNETLVIEGFPAHAPSLPILGSAAYRSDLTP